MRCLRCQQENPPQAKLCLECAAPINGATSALSSSAEMKAEIEGLRRSLTEALDHRTATSEILGIISRSRTDVQPVFDTIVRSAEKLCNGLFGALVRYDGELVHFVAQHNFPPAALDEVRRIWPTRPSRASGAGRAILDRAVVQIPDIELDPEYGLQRLSRAVGHRSSIYVPMLRDGLPIGVIIVARAEAGGFADNQVELLKTFADQAVIAIENVRLFTELQEKNQALSQAHAQVTESLEQQTATSEILRVIAGSPTDLQPVLDALVENAGRLCQAADTALLLVEGDQLRVAASHGYVEGRVIGFSNPIQRGWVAGRAVVDARTVHVEDLATAEADFPLGREIAVRFGHRTALATPLLREGAPIGALFLRRRQVRPFSDKEITLLQTFADQGVIAIENVRLFKELETRNRDLSEALERQTATADILRAISQAQTDVQPVFEALADSAMRLLGAWGAAVGRYDGELLSLAAARGGLPGSADAARERLQPPHRPSAPPEQAVLTKRVQHVVDVETDPSCSSEFRRHAAARGFRSFVAVPMLRGSDPLGMIAVIRAQPGGFSTGEIALLETFADQAVIAIENVRLFNELQDKNRALTQAHAQVSEALEQQTATSEILRVISSSPTDVQPVFETIITNAVTLCDAREASVFRFDGELIHLVASNIMDESFLDSVRGVFPRAPGQGSVTARAILTRGVTHVPDIAADPEYEHTSLVQSGRRTVLSVPMMKDSHPIGAITVARRDVRSFTDKQIDLLNTFASQAVIAIENVRLFEELQARNRELTETLEQQTATSEILRVISRSHTDLQAVFDTVLHSAGRLCAAAFGALQLFDGELLTLDAHYGISPDDIAMLQAQVFPMRPDHGSTIGRAVLSRAVVHVGDIRTDPEFRVTQLQMREAYRTALSVPMLRAGAVVGVINLWRREVQPFSDSQVHLVETFADQAVIAIENVRLFTELQEKNQALTQAHAQVTEALEQQTATAEVLSVISSSPTDLQPVLDTVVKSAARFCGADDATIFQLDGTYVRLAAHHGPIPSRLGNLVQVVPGSVVGRCVLERRAVHAPDVQTDVEEFPEASAVARQVGYRTQLSVPLLREGAAIGAIQLRRADVDPFSEKQISLLQAFADQAVIAIENVRLFKELETKNHDLTTALEQQTATAEVLKVISRSTFDLQPVLDILIENAARLCGAPRGVILRRDSDLYRGVAFYNASPELVDYVRSHPITPGRHSITARVALEGRTIHVADLQTDTEYAYALRDVDPVRTELGVPMFRGDEILGVIILYKFEVHPFTDKQIELIETFANQAVIAIENVRLFKELEARTAALTRSVDQLTALGEVGRAVSSTLDLETVLTTIVARAVELSGLDGGVVFEYDEDTEEFVQRVATQTGEALAEARRTTRIRKGEGVLGRTAVTLEPVQVPDITAPGAYEGRLRETLIGSGIRAVLAVPMLREGHLIGCLGVTRKRPGDFPAETIDLLRTFATQSALAIQNARLFHEIEDKSRQLEAASRHKSEFLANMSHELRTPLNAIIGFSEVLGERMFGELNEKQEEYLKDIHASGQHLLSLINDILDLSKIEAGRMELELTDFHLPAALDNALTLVRERAGRRGIALHAALDDRIEYIRADERKIKQVLLNLLSNAIKFTPEGGRIDVRAALGDGVVEVSVSDTGVGIAPEDQEAIFEEFRQVGTAAKKVEGTGLGLALSRKFVELHGGRIWVESQVGEGSTFTFTIPVRCGE